MLNIKRVFSNQRLMSALTSVTPQEFNNLIPAFSQAWLEEKRKQHKKSSKERKIGGERKGFLKTIEEKLPYILFYHKCYPTYDLASLIFDCARSNACRRQFELSNILEKTLGRKLVLPVRKMRTLEEFYSAFPEAREVFIDGTERPIQRSRDKKANYSGKKKRHTKKNIVITTTKNASAFWENRFPAKKTILPFSKNKLHPILCLKKSKNIWISVLRESTNSFPDTSYPCPRKNLEPKNLLNLPKNKIPKSHLSESWWKTLWLG